MSALNIELPDALRSRVQARATESGFDSVEEYVQALLLADATTGPTVNDEQLELLLLSRVDGPFVDVDAADFKAMRVKLRARLEEGDAGDASEPRP